VVPEAAGVEGAEEADETGAVGDELTGEAD